MHVWCTRCRCSETATKTTLYQASSPWCLLDQRQLLTAGCERVQVGGFLQRIDYVRKHAFAVLSILKDDKGQFPIRLPSLQCF